MNEFETTDINGNTCQFQYVVEIGDQVLTPNEIIFKVYSMQKDDYRWFTYKVLIVDELLAKSEMISNNSNSEFSKKGIPEKIIVIAANYLRRSIISSPIVPNSGNFLVETSIKAWQRLVSQNNQARFDNAKGCFIFEWKSNLGDSQS